MYLNGEVKSLLKGKERVKVMRLLKKKFQNIRKLVLKQNWDRY